MIYTIIWSTMSFWDSLFKRLIEIFVTNSRVFKFASNILLAFLITLTLNINFEFWKTHVGKKKYLFKYKYFIALDWCRFGKPNKIQLSSTLTFDELSILFNNFMTTKILFDLRSYVNSRGFGKFSKLKRFNLSKKHKYQIIIPVYNGYEIICKTLPVVIEQAKSNSMGITIINDASTDYRVVNFLQKVSQSYSGISLINNQTNLGYTKTVNLALRNFSKTNFLVLNSDALIPSDFIPKMISASLKHPNTLISPIELTFAPNCETPFTIPIFAKGLQDDSAKALTKRLEELNSILIGGPLGGKHLISPTIHGFVFFLPHSVLKKIGFFDEILFPRGYGEENDYSQNGFKKGFKSLIKIDLAVFHFGTASFTSSEKSVNSQAAKQVLLRKHPRYFIYLKIFDEISKLRSILLDFLTDNLTFDLHLLVSSGGGSSRFANQDFSKSPALNLYICAKNDNSIEIYLNSIGKQPFLVLNLLSSQLSKILGHINLKNFICHYLAENLRSSSFILNQLNPRVHRILRLHDYHPICPQNFLSDHTFNYCGEPDNKGCAKCILLKTPNRQINISQWRNTLKSLLESFDEFSVPSLDTKQRFEKYFPHLQIKCYVPTGLLNESPFDFVDKSRVGGRNLGIIGNIGLDKGLLNLSSIIESSSFVASKIKCYGFGDFQELKSYPIAGLVKTGPFDDEFLQDLYSKIVSLDVGVIFFPGKIPETFSIVLSHVIRMRLPVIAFDIGAIPERLRKTNLRHLILPIDEESGVSANRIISFVNSDSIR